MSKENKCEFLRMNKICSLPDYDCECHYGEDYESCSAASFFRENGHTDYTKATGE